MATVIYIMVMLPQINKITFEESENLGKKNHISQNLAKILAANCFFFFFFFLKKKNGFC